MKLTVHRIFLVSTFIPVLRSDDGGTLPSNNTRIVGGFPCKIKTYPFVISLRRIDRHPHRFCGGVLIRTNWVLTAAHCTNGKKAENLYIVAGITFATDADGQTSYVMLIVQHAGYRPTNFVHYNDISLLKLESDIELDQSAGLATLPSKGFTAQQKIAMAMGWGNREIRLRKRRTILAHHLMCVELPIITIEDCKRKWGFIGRVETFDEKLWLCTLFAEGGKDTCQGDSGSGVTVGQVVVGLVSFGAGCAQPNMPGVNTNVEGYLDWINETLYNYAFYTQHIHRKAGNRCSRLTIIPFYLLTCLRWLLITLL